MNTACNRFLALVFSAILFAGAATFAAPAGDGLKNIQNADGSHIVFGQLAGQLTPQAAMGQLLHQVSLECGDRPQLGRLLQNPSGEILAAFFTVTAKKQDGQPMAGLALVSLPQNGNATAAILADHADRFPSSVNSFSASNRKWARRSLRPLSKTHQPMVLLRLQFPQPRRLFNRRDLPMVAVVIGLPVDWTVVRAQLGDVLAKGPRGEMLRFGMTIAILDPTNPQSRQLMGQGNRSRVPPNFVAVPISADPATAFKSATAQLAQKNGKQPPTINISKVQELPIQGGKSNFLYGDIDLHDGNGPQSLVAQAISTPPQQFGSWQMTVFHFQAPPKIMAEERATVAAIFPNYSRNSAFVNAKINQQIQVGIEQTNQFVHDVQVHMDNSDRFTAGMSDFLRNQTVIVDTQEGGHARTSDQLADLLMQTSPDRFQAVPTSQYIRGIDY